MLSVVDLSTLRDHSVSLEGSSSANQVVSAILRRGLASPPAAEARRNSSASSSSDVSLLISGTYGLYAIRSRDEGGTPTIVAHRLRGEDRPLHVLRQLRKINPEPPQFVLGGSTPVATRFVMGRLEDEFMMPFRVESASSSSPFFRLVSRLGPRDLCGYFDVGVNSGLWTSSSSSSSSWRSGGTTALVSKSTASSTTTTTTTNTSSSSSSSAERAGDGNRREEEEEDDDDDMGRPKRRWVVLVGEEFAIFKNHEMERSGKIIPLAHASVSVVVASKNNNNHGADFEVQTPTMSFTFSRPSSSSPSNVKSNNEVTKWVEALRERSVWCTENEMISVAERMLTDITEAKEKADFAQVRAMLRVSDSGVGASSSSTPRVMRRIGDVDPRTAQTMENNIEEEESSRNLSVVPRLPDLFRDLDFALRGFWKQHKRRTPASNTSEVVSGGEEDVKTRFESLLIEFARRFTTCEYLLLWYMDALAFERRRKGGEEETSTSTRAGVVITQGGGALTTNVSDDEHFREVAFEARALNERGKTLLLSTPVARAWLERAMDNNNTDLSMNPPSSSPNANAELKAGGNATPPPSNVATPIPPSSPKFKNVVNFDLKQTTSVIRGVLNEHVGGALARERTWMERIVAGSAAGR